MTDIRWDNVRPLPPEIEEKLLRDMCAYYVGVLNPVRPPPPENRISRRCQHCGAVFQAGNSVKPEPFCSLCR